MKEKLTKDIQKKTDSFVFFTQEIKEINDIYCI